MKFAAALLATSVLATPALAIMGNTEIPIKPAVATAQTDAVELKVTAVTVDTAHMMSADCVTGPIEKPEMFGMPTLGVDCGLE